MKFFSFVAVAIAANLFLFNACDGQTIAHAKTTSVKIYGNCGMCEKTIEKAAAQKGIANADWDTDTKMAQITFDSSQTTLDDVLKRIAAAGYDSDKFRAPDEVYAGLHACCQYDRPKTTTSPMPAGMTKKKAAVATETPKN